jgi:hypothetical protein
VAVISNEQIAILCGVGEGTEIDADKTHELNQLMAEGFIERMSASSSQTGVSSSRQYKLTPKGQQFISERGAGLNEA